MTATKTCCWLTRRSDDVVVMKTTEHFEKYFLFVQFIFFHQREQHFIKGQNEEAVKIQLEEIINGILIFEPCHSKSYDFLKQNKKRRFL